MDYCTLHIINFHLEQMNGLLDWLYRLLVSLKTWDLELILILKSRCFCFFSRFILKTKSPRGVSTHTHTNNYNLIKLYSIII